MATKKNNKSTSKTTKRAKKVGTTPRATKKAEQARALSVKCDKIKKLELAATSDECKSRYGIGVEISAVMKESNTYGTGAVQTIARAIGRDANTLYDYAKVAAAWPDAKAFDALCKEKNAVDVPLSFSHFIVLSKADKEQRETLRKLALKESLSVAALNNRANPAKQQKPVEALSHTVSNIAKRIGTWQTDLEAHIKGVDPAELSNLTDACDRAAEALQVFANTLREQSVQSLPRTGPGPASTSKDTSSKAAE